MLRHECQFGLCSVILQWFSSYLSDKYFKTVLGGNCSFVVYLLCSVPLGSVIGPHMLIMSTADLADFVGERQVNFHSYADDSQTYLHCLPGDVDSVVCQLRDALQKSATRRLPIVLSSMQIRPSLSGLVPDIT